MAAQVREEGFDKFYNETPRSNLKFDSHNSIMSIVNTTPMSIIKTDFPRPWDARKRNFYK